MATFQDTSTRRGTAPQVVGQSIGKQAGQYTQKTTIRDASATSSVAEKLDVHKQTKLTNRQTKLKNRQTKLTRVATIMVVKQMEKVNQVIKITEMKLLTFQTSVTQP